MRARYGADLFSSVLEVKSHSCLGDRIERRDLPVGMTVHEEFEQRDLEQIILPELIEFEASIARAVDGVAPQQEKETLNAAQFLTVLNDLCTFAVQLWDTDYHRTTSSLELA